MAEPASSTPRLSELAGPLVRPAEAPWLDGLNAAQREAVEALDGPVLVLAGAGTGKTRALTTRIAQILGSGRAKPYQILAVTFTNKAAREMQQRVEALVQPIMGRGATEGLWLGTFHALAARILRVHAELVGLKPNFTILDPDDQIRLIKQLLEADNVDTKKWPARILHVIIERWKDKGLRPDQVNPADVGDFAGGRALAIYTAYQERLRTLNAVDFGDLLLHNLTLFTQHEDVLDKYQRRFRYILVDEYQDTNVAQYLWLRLLAQREKNICCVGDDDQSIYGWRGAEVGNILKFEQDFPGARIIRLEQNYRSTPPILAAASHLIAHNEGRLGKTLWTDADGGEKVRLRGIWDGEEEARIIGELVEDMQRHGHPLSEIAILVRASFQTREFEERFITLGVPYRVVGGPRFYERMEIRDAVAYLRLLNSPDDDLAFERIVNKPKRGLGDAAVQALHRLARDRGVPMSEAARLLAGSDDLRPQARNALGKFVEMLDRWRAYAETASHVEVAETVLDESGYTEMWQREKTPDAPGRLENLKELVRALEEFDNLGGFLEHISLVMETNENAQGDMVNIMTLHSAKGLEFDTVFLPGWEEGVFPHQRALDESRPGRARGGAAARLCRPDPGAQGGPRLVRRQPAHPQPVAERDPVALHRRAAGRAGRSGDRAGPLRRWRPRGRPARLFGIGVVLERRLERDPLVARAGAAAGGGPAPRRRPRPGPDHRGHRRAGRSRPQGGALPAGRAGVPPEVRLRRRPLGRGG